MNMVKRFTIAAVASCFSLGAMAAIEITEDQLTTMSCVKVAPVSDTEVITTPTEEFKEELSKKTDEIGGTHYVVRFIDADNQKQVFAEAYRCN